MGDVLQISKLEQFAKFKNDKDIIEIVLRDGDRKYKAFQKVMINELPKLENKQAVQDVVNAINKNNLLNAENLKKLEYLTKINNVGLLLNGLNLCATCVGFAIIYAKLDKMSKDIDKSLQELKKNVKDVQDVQTGYTFKTVVQEHRNMLDKKRIHKPYSEDQLRDLVDKEYNVLDLLIEVLKRDVSNDNRQLIISIYAMASMLAASLIEFDEVYYLNNKESLPEGEYWHSSHDTWMSEFDILSEKWFVEKLQDIGLFELNLDTAGVDMYYEELQDQAVDIKQEIIDNDTLISMISDIDMLENARQLIDQEVEENIDSAIKDISENVKDPKFVSVCKDAKKQVLQAV